MLVTFFLNTNYVLMYYGVFKLNQTILTESVCEKKTEGCNACCYLNKKIEQEGSDSKATAELVKTKEKLSEFVVKYFSLPETRNTTSFSSIDNFFNLSPGYFSLPGKPPQIA